jgi:hypothetical protein
MKIKVKLKGQREFKRDIERFAKKSKTDIHGALLMFSASAGKDLAHETNPKGLGASVKKGINEGIAKDVKMVYLPKPLVHKMLKAKDKRKAAGFMRAMRDGNYEAAGRITRSVIDTEVGFDDGKFLEGQRNKRGRVSRGSKKLAGMSTPEINAIIKQSKKTTGTAKAGWFSAIKKLKTKTPRAAKWLMKESKLGSAKVKKKRTKSTVYLINRVSYIRENLPANKVRKSLKTSEMNFKKRIEMSLNKTIRQTK